MVKQFAKLVYRNKVYSPTKHLGIFGLSGYGKGVVAERVIAEKSGRHKVIDFFSEERGEGFLYNFPNNDYSMKRKLDWLSEKRLKTKGYNNEIVMFLGNDLLVIPKLPKNVRIVTFDEKDLTNDDLIDFLCYNESQRGLMSMILYNNTGKRMTFSNVESYLIRAKTPQTKENEEMKGAHRMTMFVLLRRIASIKQSGLFYEGDPKLFKKFNFKEFVKDRNTITTFSTLLLPKEEHRGLAMGIVMKKVLELRRKTDIEIPVLFYIREMSYFYRDSAPTYYNLLKEGINKILREGRDLKYTLVVDSQLPTDLPSYVWKMFNKIICLRIPNPKILLEKARIHPATLNKMTILDEKGVGIYISSGKYRYPIYFPPTLHQKKEEGINVFQQLGKKFGWIDYKGSQFLELDVEVTNG